MDASNDGGESVDQFLARIASLSSKQGPEDAERSKRTEEEMLQARKERQARRAERARSLSPSKTGPAPSSRPIEESPSKINQGIEPPVALTPPLQSRTLRRSGSISPTRDRAAVAELGFSRPLPPPPTNQEPTLPSPPANTTTLSRSGTLSWQQRPLSRGGTLRSRPLSVASIPDLGPTTQTGSQQITSEEMSRKDIAASLGAKDPSWFRQTADRGATSAAYRKNETESEQQSSFTSRGLRLPGMSKATDDHSTKEPEKSTPPASPPKSSYTLPSSQRDPSNPSQTVPRPSSMVASSPTKSPALDLPAFKPLDLNTSLGLDSPSLGRTSSILSTSGRPPSPTKGLGGFVESAMMKRSDSVSKRWSVQANAGLKRGDSVASARPTQLAGVAGYTPGHGRTTSRDVRGIRDGNSSPLSSSRPVSSHGEPIPITRGRSVPPVEDEAGQSSNAGGAEAAIKKTSETGQQERPVTPPTADSLLSRSPSKTMDPRRWSPTKASWLESALNKPPESPRAAKPETPAWRISMQRAKQDQQPPPAANISDVSTKPATAPKPLDFSVSETAMTLDKTSTVGNTAKLVSIKKTALEPSRSSDGFTPVRTVLRTDEKKDDKPTVPSKRNVTPVPMSSSVSKDEGSHPIASPKAEEKSTTLLPGPASPELQSGTKAPALKPKPQTPPKTDFRASLKSRQAAPAGSNDLEPEFKSMFGKLKRTQTQNYVAPDVLKDNITTGKAALTITGGPQKTKRVDEFKESILQKKEAMKVGSASVGKRVEAKTPAEKAGDQVPEALAKRMALQKTGTSSEQVDTQKQTDGQAKIRALASKPQAAPEKPKPIDLASKPNVSGLNHRPSSGISVSTKEENPPPVQAMSNALNSSLPKTTQKPETVAANVLAMKPDSDVPTRSTQTIPEPSSTDSTPATEPTFKAKLSDNSKLAARLNPALAGILSRSSSPKPSGDTTHGGGIIQTQDSPQLSRQSTKEEPAELTHMTKGRAKGPKRRGPKSSPASAEGNQTPTKKPGANTSTLSLPAVSSPEPLPESSRVLPVRPLNLKPAITRPATLPDVAGTGAGEPKRQSSAPDNMKVEKPTASAVPRSLPAVPKPNELIPEPIKQMEPESKPKPVVASKSIELRKVSSTGTPVRDPNEIAPLKPTKSADLRKVSSAGTPNIESPPVNPSTSKKIEVLPDLPKSFSSPPDTDGDRTKTPLTSPPAPILPLTPNKSKLNTPKIPKPSVDSSAKPTPMTPSKTSGLGLQLGSASRKLAPAPVLTPPPDQELAATRVKLSPQKGSSPTKLTSSVRPQLENFLGALSPAGEKAEFDTHAFLSTQNKTVEKSKTLSKQIWEVSGDGKKTPMPPQQDHILFEDSMYLCVHSMQIPSGSKSSEVYLWCGDEVPEAAVEDAQLFCRKVARENSAKLEVVRQGKESSEFFQALGGIVIVRRNKSSALYMLCGRRHLGHVAFDEVDMSADSLCTGLPYLISAKFGKLYLWKGKGSNLEDVGCARLIGMDLGLTGEIEEISEGEEPASFWESLSSRAAKRAASRSGQQSEQPRPHAPRLYRIEHDRPKSSGGLGGLWGLRAASPPKQSLKALVEEIAPFNQKDVDGYHIHILDAYRELYVLIGSFAKKPAEFVTAIQIAQEIAVLSPSVQDRPVLPASYVVMGDPPQHIKAMFRKWRPQSSPGQDSQMYVRVEDVVHELGISV